MLKGVKDLLLYYGKMIKSFNLKTTKLILLKFHIYNVNIKRFYISV